MVSLRCKLVVKDALKKMRQSYVGLDLGVVELQKNMTAAQHEQLRKYLSVSGLVLLDDIEGSLMEKLIYLIIEMVHYSDEFPTENYAEYISTKLKCDYKYLSLLFSEVKGITIKQCFSIHKVEKIKELLIYDDISMTEIARRLRYKSLAVLSMEFKKLTGLTPTFFRAIKRKKYTASAEK
jgi:AraC-like DNA-binding protein